MGPRSTRGAENTARARHALRKRYLLPAAAAAAAFALIPGSANAAYPGSGALAGDISVHDPSMVRPAGGYVVYSTHNGVEARTSTPPAALPSSVGVTTPGPARLAVVAPARVVDVRLLSVS
ncbi:hypothetical protein [Streptomyces sp. NPDC052225]|uniref:hypothetical protein n=1 Tax=Streptomyces sp. NPDC052225 TaxID=3154949 RepID=UPI003414440D